MIRTYRNPETFPETDFVKYVSIDPAIKNFVMRIETRKGTEIEANLFELVKLGSGKKEKIETILTNLQSYLDSVLHLLSDVRLVVIETQMDKTPMIKIQYYLLGFFMNCPLFFNTIILEISPKLKGKALGCSKGLNKYALKKWSVEKAKEICERNGDIASLEILKAHKKSKKNELKDDDLADTVIMLEAVLMQCE